MLKFNVKMVWEGWTPVEGVVEAINEKAAAEKFFEEFKQAMKIYVGQNLKSSLSMGWLTVEVKLA